MADHLIGLGLLLVGVSLDITSIVSNEWIAFPNGSTSGLWALCAADGVCRPINTNARLEGVRAMMVLSVLVSGMVLLLLAVYITYAYMKRVKGNGAAVVAASFTFFSVLLALIGILIYHMHIWKEISVQNKNIHRGYAFWLGVTAIIFFFVSGIIFLVFAILYDRQWKQEHNNNNSRAVAIYNSKPEAAKNDAYSESHLQNPKLYPLQYDYMYYDMVHLSPGFYRHGDREDIHRGPRVTLYDSDHNVPKVHASSLPITYIA